MRFLSLGSVAILASLLAMPAAAAAQAQQTVNFARGQTSTVVTGAVRGRQYVDYLVNVRRGEALSVSMTSTNRNVFFDLIGPSGAPYYVGSSNNPPNRFDGIVPARGTQRIRVYLYRASGRRGDYATFQLYVTMPGRPGWGQNPMLPGPAYPGPSQGYRPGGPIQCILPGVNYSQCTASVQHLGPGSAYVRVQLPNGIVRTITYSNGNAVSIDSGPPGGSFIAQKRPQDTVVQVGGETFVIPDMLLYAR